ncbi:uncharacterized protein LOC116193901 isoform X3 [Punica granatum]|uniref:Uncharacterized protein LOC116193901 isoform X3 n=1 Tax=Punica granatum TaxID=22663 RepID=A0A6P8CBR9_PUNGR|nr:uncharacterized protein LOC116193901 isoform X3 [Punica granatum]
MLYAKSSTGTTPPASNFSSSLLSIYLSPSLWMSCVHLLCNDKEIMDERRRPRKQPKTALRSIDSEEVSSIEWDFIHMTEQEEDLIYRMYRLVGDRSCGIPIPDGPIIRLSPGLRKLHVKVRIS